VEEFKKEYRDYIYVSNMTLICGTLPELVSYKALLEVHKHYRGPAITMYIREHMDDFNTLGIKIEQDLCRPEYRLTVDEPPDLMVVAKIYEALYKGNPLDLHDVYVWLDDNPKIAELNMHVGAKGCNQRAANLIDTVLYSIVPSGNKFVILDEQKRKISPAKFSEELKKMFPERKDLFE
jgi:spore coat polysaccharide biosynthesis protein SpsF